MTSITFEILLIVLLIIANGIFSGSEIAVISARKVRLEQLAKKGSSRARLALKLANSPNNFLSTVQIGITLIGILSGAVGGATVAERLRAFFATISPLAPYSQPLSIFIVVATITYLSLVIGELVPKRIALSNPEQIACRVAGPMRSLATLAAPLVHFLSISTDWLLKLLGIQASEEPMVTEEEIKGLIQQGTQAGMFEEAEQEMVSRVFRLGDRPIKTLMTPRTAIAWLDVNASMEENQREMMEYPHSYFPVGQGSLDNYLGIVRMKDLLTTYLSGQPVDLRKLVKPPLFIPENTRALNVLETFKESGTHIALVTDEYGGIEGLVTLNDLVEAIVGELPNHEDMEEPAVILREDGSWLLDGLLSVDELKELLQCETLPNEQTGHYLTLGGFVMATLERIPRSGDSFEAGRFRFEVVDMDGTRVDKVMVTPIEPVDSEPEENSEADD
ncbi:hemolysin family protein [Leptothermofonsia sp. ETS-13]|uniref:hemolysin family protein n=1 Tax=Leptothermofonsia sp. ETS-13 TaxID=3035696 RepID=UPI003BA1C84D